MSTAARSSSAPANRYRKCVETCLDNLLTYGTDRYGTVHSAMLMSIIDVALNESPEEPLLLEGYVRAQERPGRRNPGGSDLWDDQPLLHALYQYGLLAGDSRYAEAADDYIRAYILHATKPNGLLAWGSHLFYNAFTDRIDDDRHGDPHELLIHLAEWEEMWRVDPIAIQREIEGIWTWHIVDKATGQHNRHDDAMVGCDFAYSGGSFAHAFAFLFTKTGDRIWVDRARLVINWHWSHRHPKTNLAPDTPSTAPRYDSTHCFTNVTGPHTAASLRCFELTGDVFFRDVAVAYIHAWLNYAWDERAGRFFGGLQIDGTPVLEQAKGDGYDAWMPTGYSEIWPSDMYSYEQPFAAAQVCLSAYRLVKDPALLEGAQRWAQNIRASFPPVIGYRWREEIFAALPEAAQKGGAYAEGYGRAITFFVELYQITGDPSDLQTAINLADESIDRLYENGWFKGHSGKPYYESTDGVGLLLCGLLELSEAIEAKA